MTQNPQPQRIGMIVPSSNTCLEPMTYRILNGRTDVTVHFARIPVTRIALDEDSDHQFSTTAMRDAAELLAAAHVNVIAWNGTSGSWLGLEHDHAITDAITQATGIPATTSTMAYLGAFKKFGIHSVALLTPYTSDVNKLVTTKYRTHDIHVLADHGIGLSDNESFARVSPEQLLPPARSLIQHNTDALVILCTNLYGAPIVQALEQQSATNVLDSVALTLWDCLTRIGAPLLEPQWGRLLA